MEKRHSERREEMQRLLILWHLRSTGANIAVTEDVIHLFKQVTRFDFSPKRDFIHEMQQMWRSGFKRRTDVANEGV